MRMTFNVQDTVARKFLSLVPDRKRSWVVSEMIRKLLEGKHEKIAVACKNANKDAKVGKAVNEWQGFDMAIDGEWHGCEVISRTPIRMPFGKSSRLCSPSWRGRPSHLLHGA